MSDSTTPEPAKAPVQASLSRNTKWFALGALAIALAAFGVLAFGGIGENLVYYWGPKELRAAGNKAVGASIRLGGQVAPGTINFDEGSSKLEFEVMDAEARVPVKSSGVPPQMFRENIGVIVEGTMTKNGHFESNRLMVSHGNEYKAPEPGMKYDAEELMKTAQVPSTEGSQR